MQTQMNETIEINQSEELCYEKNRIEQFSNMQNFEPYPHKFATTITFQDYINKYSSIENASRHRDKIECIAGRVLEKRNYGKKLFFYTVTSNGLTIQYLADISEYEDKTQFIADNDLMCRGDIVGVMGFVGKSKKDELSIYPLKLTLLTPCYKFLPKQFYGVTDMDIRIKKRHLDMIANQKIITTFKTRCFIIKEIRNFLDNKQFIEVETPVLSSKFGGANAKPFVTYHNSLKKDMFMRIAPELYLKQLVIGGLDRVYEIGKQFRNESIDTTHVPEFTSIEFYMTYVDYKDLMIIIENLLSNLTLKVNNSHLITYNGKEINFAPPFRKIHILDELKKQTNTSFDFTDFTSIEFETFLNDLCKIHNVECGAPKTIPRLLDKLIGHFIEPQCIDPTFLTNHPLVMSPLAKHDRDNNLLSERFELFVDGMELANAYTELNDHNMQEKMFRNQQKDKTNGDEEIPLPDEDFIDALRYGLPPTGGAGMGIDRLIMILTNTTTIRDVIPFPL